MKKIPLFVIALLITSPLLVLSSCVFCQKKIKAKEMISLIEAKQKAVDTIASLTKHDKEIVLWEEKIESKPYGWYFIFTTEKYIKTHDPRYIKFGIPFVFVTIQGEVHLVSGPLENYIKRYEESLAKKNE